MGFLPTGQPGGEPDLNGDSLGFPHYGPGARQMPSTAVAAEPQ